MRITASVITGSFTISNQLEVGLIIVRQIKSVSVPALPLRVYGPIRSTHGTSQVFVMRSFVWYFPYLCFCWLLTWHVSPFLTCAQMVCLIPFQAILHEEFLQVMYNQGAIASGGIIDCMVLNSGGYYHFLSLHKNSISLTHGEEDLACLWMFFRQELCSCPCAILLLLTVKSILLAVCKHLIYLFLVIACALSWCSGTNIPWISSN